MNQRKIYCCLHLLCRISLASVVLFLVGALTGNSSYGQGVCSRTYTLDADFEQGVLLGVEHTTVSDQLQLSIVSTTFPFIWVPNYDGSISKVNTLTGNEIGRYRVGPPGLPAGGDPSRTTVDLQGSVWVGLRQAGTAVKVGLFEAGVWIDRNADGICQTSQDLNSDGDITGAEILPWGQDECVLYEVVLIPGSIGTYVPGTYAGPYDYNYWGVSPRGFGVDANNNIWIGTWSTRKFYHVNGATGAIMTTVDLAPWGHSSYGAVVDGNGMLWSAMLGSHLLKIDPSTGTVLKQIVLAHTYGIGLDYLGHLFVSGSTYLSKIDVNTGTVLWTKPSKAVRGLVCTADNNVWVAGYDATGVSYNSISRYDNEGNLLAVIGGFNAPSGVAVDGAGKVWGTDISSEMIHRIDPATNTIDLSKAIVGSGGHYTYSDMTGIVARSITTKLGTWTVDFDSEVADTPWGTLCWTASEPEGTSVTVKVRSSNDKVSWSMWETASNCIPLSATPDGRYLQIETALQITAGETSPVLYDLMVQCRFLTVNVDIKPTSCPNPLNTVERGTLPVAILGTSAFDVTQVDPATVKLAGVPPLRWALEDVATPFAGTPEGCMDCTVRGADGFRDLTLKFDARAIVSALGTVQTGECRLLTLTGNMLDGRPIRGADIVRIKAPATKEGPDYDEAANEIVSYRLDPNMPNPFNPETRIRYTVPDEVYARLAIYDVLGREISVLVDDYRGAGSYDVVWDGRDQNGNHAPSGIYFYRLTAGDFDEIRMMVLMK